MSISEYTANLFCEALLKSMKVKDEDSEIERLRQAALQSILHRKQIAQCDKKSTNTNLTKDKEATTAATTNKITELNPREYDLVDVISSDEDSGVSDCSSPLNSGTEEPEIVHLDENAKTIPIPSEEERREKNIEIITNPVQNEKFLDPDFMNEDILIITVDQTLYDEFNFENEKQPIVSKNQRRMTKLERNQRSIKVESHEESTPGCNDSGKTYQNDRHQEKRDTNFESGRDYSYVKRRRM